MDFKRSYRKSEAKEFADDSDIPEDPSEWSYSDYRHEMLWVTEYLSRFDDCVRYSDMMGCLIGAPVDIIGGDEGRGTTEFVIQELSARLNGDKEWRNMGDADDATQRAADERFLRLARALDQVKDVEYRWNDFTHRDRTYNQAAAVAVYHITDATSIVMFQWNNYASMTVATYYAARGTRNPEKKIQAFIDDHYADSFDEIDVGEPLTDAPACRT